MIVRNYSPTDGFHRYRGMRGFGIDLNTVLTDASQAANVLTQAGQTAGNVVNTAQGAVTGSGPSAAPAIPVVSTGPSSAVLIGGGLGLAALGWWLWKKR